MQKRIRFYSRLMPASRWPAEVEADFAEERGKHGVFTFDEGSDREKAFLAAVAPSGIRLAGRSEWIVRGEDLFRHPFHYLTLKADGDHPHGDYVDEAATCGGDENVWCRTGGTQIRKVTVDPKKCRGFDIMVLSEVRDPTVLIVNRRLKDTMEEAELTGFRFEPCLGRGAKPSAAEAAFGAPIADDADVTHFQLVPLLRAKEPAQLGRLLRPPMRCSKCGAVYQYWAERTPTFRRQALHDADVQQFNRYTTENEGELRIPGEVFIVSARLKRLLLESKATGLRPMHSDPSIQHGIVHLDE